MATRKPHARKSKPNEGPSDAEALLALMREIGPRHDLADAIDSVYKERHAPRSTGPREKSKRRRSTRT